LLSSLILSLLIFNASFSSAEYTCVDEYEKHPVRNEFMLQIVLKSYNYYEGKIDGQIGPISINALKEFQLLNNATADGILGPETCTKLLDKSVLVSKQKSTSTKVLAVLTSTQNKQSKYKNCFRTLVFI